MIYRTTTGSLHLRHTKIFFLCLMLTNLFKNSVFLLLVSSSRFSPITTTKFLASNIIIIIIVIFSCDRTKPYELAFHITASVSCFTRLVSNKTYIRTCSLRVIEGQNVHDQIAFCAFHSFLVAVQTKVAT